MGETQRQCRPQSWGGTRLDFEMAKPAPSGETRYGQPTKAAGLVSGGKLRESRRPPSAERPSLLYEGSTLEP